MSKPLQYPVASMHRAIEHYEAGWKPTRIREMLRQEGLGYPSLSTIYVWVNPDYRQRCLRAARDRQAKASAETARFRLSSLAEEYQQAFMVRLRREGIPCASIAKVCGVVFGVRLSVAEVRERLREIGPPNGNLGKPRRAA